MRSLKFFVAVALVSIVNVLALVAIAGYMRANAGGPYADVNGDVNGDGWINLADPVYLLSFLFSSGPPPVAIASGGPQLTAEQAEMLSHMSIEYLDDGQGGTAKTIRFTGVNVQIVNGLGATNGNPVNPFTIAAFATNSVGNLIVGYNEAITGSLRTGSHNLVVGCGSSYSAASSLVHGHLMSVSSSYAATIAGGNNVVSGDRSACVSGFANSVPGNTAAIVSGVGNTASALVCAIVAGTGNVISIGGEYGSIISGETNEVSATNGVVISGTSNVSSAFRAVVISGANNIANAFESVITGGESNTALGPRSTVSGGLQRQTTDWYDWVAGSLFEDQ